MTMAYPEITGLTVQLNATLAEIDKALDRGDRRAFRTWCKRATSLTKRLETLLLRLATAEEDSP